MSRIQALLFLLLTAVSLTFLLLGPAADFALSSHLAGVLLFPIRLVSGWTEYLRVSRNRIEELERTVAEIQLNNAALQKLMTAESLQLIPEGYDLIKANVIGRDPSNFNGFLYIDRLRSNRLAPGQPVISRDGLVGRIKYAGSLNSIVETIENPGMTVSGRDNNTGVHGMVVMDKQLHFAYVKISDPIEAGDSIFTSGMSEQFPAGIRIATVEKILITDDLLFKTVILRPCVSINQLNYVFVVLSSDRSSPPPAFAPSPLFKLPIAVPPFRH